MSKLGPWELDPTSSPKSTGNVDAVIVEAIARGLRSMGYVDAEGTRRAEWSWPDWARSVYYALAGCGLSDAGEVAVVRAVAGWPEADRGALAAADALGGSDAVRQMLGALIPPVTAMFGPREQVMGFHDRYDQARQDAEAQARDFNLACDAEGVPKRLRTSARKEHWSSVVRQAQKEGGYAYHEDLRNIVWMFGRIGPEGRKTAEAAAWLGGWKAAVDYVVAECARIGTEELAAKGRAA